MHTSVTRLLQRLLPMFAGATLASESKAGVAFVDPSTVPQEPDLGVARIDQPQTQKLVFGTARQGQPQLLGHSSHSSHSSHSLHSSHYSGSSGGSYTPYVAPPPPTPPPSKPVVVTPAPKPTPKPEVASTPAAAMLPEMASVLAKLPKIRSHWPAEAKLTKATQFNLNDGDKVVGVITLNAGAKFKILSITSQHALVMVAGNQSPLPVNQTDIIELMGGPATILALPDDPSPATEAKKAAK
jgi:hypothetical protein